MDRKGERDWSAPAKTTGWMGRGGSGGVWRYSWTAFDRLVQSGEQMVFLEQSSNFSLFPGDSANLNCFSLFLKLNFQSLRVTVDSCSPVGRVYNSGVSAVSEGWGSCLWDVCWWPMALTIWARCHIVDCVSCWRGEQTDWDSEVQHIDYGIFIHGTYWDVSSLMKTDVSLFIQLLR